MQRRRFLVAHLAFGVLARFSKQCFQRPQRRQIHHDAVGAHLQHVQPRHHSQDGREKHEHGRRLQMETAQPKQQDAAQQQHRKQLKVPGGCVAAPDVAHQRLRNRTVALLKHPELRVLRSQPLGGRIVHGPAARGELFAAFGHPFS